MMRQKRVHVGSKWRKTQVLLADRRIREYVPDTRLFNRSSLKNMLGRYSMVYIKPVKGTFGNGVMKIQQRNQAGRLFYSFHYLHKRLVFHSYPELFACILRHKLKTPYLVQKGIRLLSLRGRPFDIRVMVQKNRFNRWEATAKIGRLAQRGKIVTNYHSGGRPTEIGTLFKSYLSPEELRRYDTVLSQIGEKAAAALGKAHPGVNMVGADIGVDAQFKPWIIELNTQPDPYIFKHLNDKRIYRKVLRYARALGRLGWSKRKRRLRRAGRYSNQARHIHSGRRQMATAKASNRPSRDKTVLAAARRVSPPKAATLSRNGR